MRAAAWIKSSAPVKDLPELAWEKGILTRKVLPLNAAIAPSVLEPACSARLLAGKLARAIPLAGVRSHLADFQAELVEADNFWMIDKKLLDVLSDQGGVELLEKQLLSCIPSDEGPLWTLRAALKKVEEVARTRLVDVMGSLGERKVRSLQEKLELMAQGSEHVAEEWADSPCLTKATTNED